MLVCERECVCPVSQGKAWTCKIWHLCSDVKILVLLTNACFFLLDMLGGQAHVLHTKTHDDVLMVISGKKW